MGETWRAHESLRTSTPPSSASEIEQCDIRLLALNDCHRLISVGASATIEDPARGERRADAAAAGLIVDEHDRIMRAGIGRKPRISKPVPGPALNST